MNRILRRRSTSSNGPCASVVVCELCDHDLGREDGGAHLQAHHINLTSTSSTGEPSCAEAATTGCTTPLTDPAGSAAMGNRPASTRATGPPGGRRGPGTGAGDVLVVKAIISAARRRPTGLVEALITSNWPRPTVGAWLYAMLSASAADPRPEQIVGLCRDQTVTSRPPAPASAFSLMLVSACT